MGLVVRAAGKLRPGGHQGEALPIRTVGLGWGWRCVCGWWGLLLHCSFTSASLMAVIEQGMIYFMIMSWLGGTNGRVWFLFLFCTRRVA